MEDDVSYFRRRASEERVAALHSLHRDVRLAHLEMAARYEDLIEALSKHEEVLGLTVLNDQ